MSVLACALLGLVVTISQHKFDETAVARLPVAEDCRSLVATLFGDEIYSDDPRTKRLFSEIARSATNAYVRAKKLKPTREELQIIISENIAKHPELQKDDDTKRSTAIAVIWMWGASLDWIAAKALHEEYGGPIATSSFGAYTSITGRNAIIKQYIESGDIQFHQSEAEQEFREALQSPRVLDVTITDPKRIKQLFAVSPWQRWVAALERPAEEPLETDSQPLTTSHP